jgi:hypothetical protein
MATPNLSRLHVTAPTDAKVFEHLIAKGSAKDKRCTKHLATLPDPDENQAAYDQAVAGNCAIDGYLMYKAVVPRDADDPPPPADSYLGRPMVVALDDGTRATFASMGKRTVTARTRRDKFWTGPGSEWVEKVFSKVCDRGMDEAGKHLGSVEWWAYKDDLVKATDWYYLDPFERGHLFLQLLDTPEIKAAMDMSTSGAFAGRYLYIALVCSVPHTIGSHLMAMAEAACRTLGCEGIALATLSNSAEFYLAKGFRFMSRDEGRPIDVSPWLYTTEIGGRARTKLHLTRDVPEATRKRWRPMEEEGAEPRKRGSTAPPDSPPVLPPSSPTVVAEKRRLWDAYETAVDKARGLYQRWARLSAFR